MKELERLKLEIALAEHFMHGGLHITMEEVLTMSEDEAVSAAKAAVNALVKTRERKLKTT
jgi:hypothetical protein